MTARLTVVPIERPVNEDVVGALQGMLTMAKEGLIENFAIAAVHRDGAVTTAFVSDTQVFALLGAIEQLSRRVSSSLKV